MHEFDVGALGLRCPNRDVLHVLLLAICDVLAIFGAFNLAFAIRTADPKPLQHRISVEAFAGLVAALSPVWVLLFALAGLYSVKQRRGRPSELGRTVLAVGFGVMSLIVYDFLDIQDVIFPARAVPLYAVPIGTVSVFAGRQLVRVLLHAFQRRGHALHRVVLVGNGPLAGRIAASLAEASSGSRIVAAVIPEADGGLLGDGTPVFSTLEAALAAADAPIDEVVQADIELSQSELAKMMSLATSQGITYRFIPDQYGVYAAASSMTTISGIPVMNVRLTALDGWGSIAKRSFDIIGSIALMIILSPVLLGLALMVKLTDPAGPALYSQDRIGRGGARLRVLKFRSMRWQYSTGPDRPYRHAPDAFAAMGREDLIDEFRAHHKVQNDPRITKVGRLLRRTSLDELPQLWNVLRGELSLIGPRPVTAEELVRYGAQRASFLALKPGITGLWQVSGRNDVSYDERVKLDVFYVENWSMKLDLTILAKTMTAVLAKKGAY